MEGLIALIITLFAFTVVFFTLWSRKKRQKDVERTLTKPFKDEWRNTLENSVLFYSTLSLDGKGVFEERVKKFLATKKIEPIEVTIDDNIRVLVAASAVIPTFAFPEYNYPAVHTVLVYPNSFDEEFRTDRFEGHKEFITGMVGNRSMEGTVILSKPDLVKSFDGKYHKENVGVHEFVHLLDKEDGTIDGIPAALLEKRYSGPWLAEIKKETDLIMKGRSDIPPYALTSNSEFLAVVSEYFFDHPDQFRKKHAELYNYLVKIFHQQPDHKH